jgi:Ca-activated chloride channel family protein
MPLSIKYHKVQVEIDNQVAITKVDQVFTNPHNRDLEGTYLFPIPENANIRKFSMWVDGEELEGRILEKDEARQIYEDIVRQQKDPALLEYAERGVFKARVYPIPAKGEKRITLEYEELLEQDSGLIGYKYSLDTEKFSVKPLEIASVDVEISSKQPVLNVYSPSHKINTDRIDETHVNVHYAEENTKPDEDFLLYYTVSTEDIGLNLLSYKDANDDGFFLAMASPNVKLSQQKVLEKNVMFILDTSGSMQGEKIVQARDALIFCLNSLNEGDKFNLIDFDSSINPYRNALVDAERGKVNDAVEYVRGVEADGGTDINNALLEGVEQMKQSSNPNIIVFLTDGLPTVGETSISRIIKNVKERNRTDTRIFVFGVGYDVNTELLDKIAVDNGGSADYVEPEEDIEVKVSNFFAKVSNPILTDVEMEFSNVRTYDIYPQQIPDIFKGTQLILLGRYKNGGNSLATLSGEAQGKSKKFEYEVRFPRSERDHDYIPRIWASRKIGYLLDEIRLNGEKDELVDEIVRLSKKYGIVTEYTSFLVDMDSQDWSNAPEDVQRQHMKEEARSKMDDAFSAPSVGERAVKRSKGAKSMQAEAQAPAQYYDSGAGEEGELSGLTAQQTIKIVADKTFYLIDEVWTDEAHNKEKNLIKIKPYSDAYFELMKSVPKLNQYLSIGENVIVNLGEYSIQIDEDGQESLSDKEIKQLQRRKR